MEDEAFFLYAAHQLKPLPRRLEGGKEVEEYLPVIKRAGIRRPDKESPAYHGFVFKRVPIDFDPAGKQLGYIVVIHTKIEDSYVIVRDRSVYFVEITETEEEANAVKLRVEENKGSGFLEKGLKFDRVSVEPVLISEF
jgi:hypothetical protein